MTQAMRMIRIPTHNLNRDQWRELRRKGIGGSDAAAIVGLSPYATPYTLWADKTGRLPDREDNEAMRQGRDLEDYVARRFTELSKKKVRRCNAILRSPDYPCALANVDREIVGEQAGLECKTTSVLNLKQFRGGDFPANYYAQCVHYMAVTRYKRWYLAVMVLGREFKVYQLTRYPDDPCPAWCEASVYVDHEEIEALMMAEEQFWATYVAPDVAPPVDGLPPTSRALSAIYTGGDDVALTLCCADAVNHYLELKLQAAMLDAELEKQAQIIKAEMGDHERATCGPCKVLWTTQARRTFDARRYAKDHPHLDMDSYYKISSYRKFEIKEVHK